MHTMRTTITLEPETEAIVRRLMRERGLSFTEAVNEAIRADAPLTGRREFRSPTFDMGQSAVPVEHAVRLAGELEDKDLVR